MACDVHEGAADNLGHFVILGIHSLNEKSSIPRTILPFIDPNERFNSVCYTS